MTALTIGGVELTQTVAAELLALHDGEPLTMSDDDALSAISQVLAAHHSSLKECLSDLSQRYCDDPGYTSTRMSCCVQRAARLLAVTV